MEQYNENQYDDDLTVGTDEYDDSYYTGTEDLFDLATDQKSPISRLKSLVLSIDWEITDEVLMQFNEELVDLRDIWSGNKINLIYVQALEKISKYIYQKKADSHPSAIKLLLTLYHNLEKIVSSDDLSESEKKQILLEDVKRFEGLKKKISEEVKKPPQQEVTSGPEAETLEKKVVPSTDDTLVNLKAIVLGIDWEITDQDLNDLRSEVVRLEDTFAGSKPKLILLQGIGTLGAYVKLKKSNAHADTFGLLHFFYKSLERIVSESMSLEEQKSTLIPAVEKFNEFKNLLGSTISPEAVGRKEDRVEEEVKEGTGDITPAFSDIPEDEVSGFQADDEAKALGLEVPENVDSRVSELFPEEQSEQPDEVAKEKEDSLPAPEEELPKEIETLLPADGTHDTVDRVTALQGVAVETEADDDSGLEKLLEVDGEVAPALTESDEASAFSSDALDEAEQSGDIEDEVLGTVTELFGEEDEKIEAEERVAAVHDEPADDNGIKTEEEIASKLDDMINIEENAGPVEKDIALQGVDVESEADDDSDEDALPVIDGEVAPAFALDTEPEAQLFDDKEEGGSGATADESQEVLETIDGFFDIEDEEQHTPTQEPVEGEKEADAVIDTDDDVIDAPSEQAVAFDSSETEVELFVEDEVEKEEEIVEEITDDFLDIKEEPDAVEDSLFDFSEPSLTNEDVGAQELIEKEVAAEIDDNFDGLFDFEEPGSVLETALPLTPLVGDAKVDAAEEFVFTDDFIDEEVVFELVDEDDLSAGQELEPSTVEGSSLVTPRSGLSAPVTGMGSQLVTSQDFVDVPENQTVEIDEDFSTDDGVYVEQIHPLAELELCIESLGVEVNDKVIGGLNREVEALLKKYNTEPLNRTFIQLLATVTSHIDRNRYDSSSEAYQLLQTIYGSLKKLDDKDLVANQELLFAETKRVLDWQQKIADRE